MENLELSLLAKILNAHACKNKKHIMVNINLIQLLNPFPAFIFSIYLDRLVEYTNEYNFYDACFCFPMKDQLSYFKIGQQQLTIYVNNFIEIGILEKVEHHAMNLPGFFKINLIELNRLNCL